MLRPSTRMGSPALGMALMGLEENCIMRSMVSSVALGPTEQLRPIASTGQESISRVKVSVSVPPGRWPKSSMVTWATIGMSSPAASRAGEHGFAQLVEVAEGFEDQQIDAGFEQRVDLLAEGGAGFGEGGGAERLDAHAQRADGAGDEWPSFGGFARQAHAGLVDVLQLFGDAEGRQARAVGAEGVGFEDLGAGLDVFLVDLADQVGLREVQLVEAAVDEDAARVEHGAHGAIGHHDAAGQLIAELLGAGTHGCSHGKSGRKSRFRARKMRYFRFYRRRRGARRPSGPFSPPISLRSLHLPAMRSLRRSR